jgi:hypothetical protein
MTTDPRKKLKKTKKQKGAKEQPQATEAKEISVPETEPFVLKPDTDTDSAMPSWAKYVIGAFIGGVICFLIVATIGVYYLADFQRNATDPQKIDAALADIAEFQKPLPPGFSATAATPIFGIITSVNIDHQPDQQTFTFVKKQNLKNLTLAQLLQEEQTHRASRLKADEFLPVKQGSQLVAGETMQYVISDLQRDGTPTGQDLIGVITPKASKSAISIHVYNPKKINLPETTQLLGAIKGFGNARTDQITPSKRSGSTNNPD